MDQRQERIHRFYLVVLQDEIIGISADEVAVAAVVGRREAVEQDNVAGARSQEFRADCEVSPVPKYKDAFPV